MSTKLVFFGGSKGGVGKSATSHLACLGAVLCDQAAAYVLTDPDREIREQAGPLGLAIPIGSERTARTASSINSTIALCSSLRLFLALLPIFRISTSTVEVAAASFRPAPHAIERIASI